MNIVLFGSTELTLSIAEFLYANSYNLLAIITVPQTFSISYRPEKVNNSRFVDMKKWGLDKNIPVVFYENANSIIEFLRNLTLDFAIVAGWYHMIPQSVRNLFPKGCAGFHSSLLPQLRGGAPLNWAILLGLSETGVSFFELANGIDDGLLYAQEKFLITTDVYIGDLIKKSETAILNILADVLPRIECNQIKKYEQTGAPSYCGQRIPEDSLIDWNKSAEVILRLIRASSKPYSGAYSLLGNEKIIIWEAEISDLQIYGIPGQIIVVNKVIHVICGEGALVIKMDDVQIHLTLLKSNQKRLN